jgi:hypothetical protein
VVGAGVALQELSARTTLTVFALVVGAAIVLTAPRLLRRPASGPEARAAGAAA